VGPLFRICWELTSFNPPMSGKKKGGKGESQRGGCWETEGLHGLETTCPSSSIEGGGRERLKKNRKKRRVQLRPSSILPSKSPISNLFQKRGGERGRKVDSPGGRQKEGGRFQPGFKRLQRRPSSFLRREGRKNTRIMRKKKEEEQSTHSYT